MEIEPLQQLQKMANGQSKEKLKVKHGHKTWGNSYSIKTALRMKRNSTICAICVNINMKKYENTQKSKTAGDVNNRGILNILYTDTDVDIFCLIRPLLCVIILSPEHVIALLMWDSLLLYHSYWYMEFTLIIPTIVLPNLNLRGLICHKNTKAPVWMCQNTIWCSNNLQSRKYAPYLSQQGVVSHRKNTLSRLRSHK